MWILFIYKYTVYKNIESVFILFIFFEFFLKFFYLNRSLRIMKSIFVETRLLNCFQIFIRPWYLKLHFNPSDCVKDHLLISQLKLFLLLLSFSFLFLSALAMFVVRIEGREWTVWVAEDKFKPLWGQIFRQNSYFFPKIWTFFKI